jgi:hypothetical protein
VSYNPDSPLVANVWNRLPVGGEFQGYNGDCTEYSFMVGCAGLDPHRACDKAELDRLTALAIQHGDASSSGAMTAANLASLCQLETIAYQQGDGSTWLPQLHAHGNVLPLVVQVANGQALPGNEQGVQGHAIVVLAVDPTYTRLTIANGDSANGKAGQLDYATVQDIANARPFAVTTLGHVPSVQDYQKRLSDVAHLASAPV